jgi:plastocyanin
MKKILLTTALVMLATPAFAKEYTIKEISDPAGPKPYYFEPSKLTIQPGDTVTFLNMQEDMHDVMFDVVPKTVKDAMIMGPEQDKEGQKWSYTFNTPGTYHFHCHPHEKLGMQGTLIVGQASKPGETKNVDHDAMMGHMEGASHNDADHHADASAGLPQATGKINSVDGEKHTVNVSHDPIAALSWPAMTMDFPVAKDVDLSGLKAGDSVSFTLKPGDNNQYSVVSLKKN